MGFAIAGRKEDGGKVQPKPTGKRGISRLAIATIVMFLLALVSSLYASAQMIN